VFGLLGGGFFGGSKIRNSEAVCRSHSLGGKRASFTYELGETKVQYKSRYEKPMDREEGGRGTFTEEGRKDWEKLT